MGAALRVPFTISRSWLGDLRSLQRGGTTLVALTPDPGATPLGTFAATVLPKQAIALMLGAEAPGLSTAARDAADARVRIPITPDVDSLNVVVAAGIALAFCAGT